MLVHYFHNVALQPLPAACNNLLEQLHFRLNKAIKRAIRDLQQIESDS